MPVSVFRKPGLARGLAFGLPLAVALWLLLVVAGHLAVTWVFL